MHLRIVRIIFCLVGICLIVSLSRDILRLSKSSNRIKEAEQKVVALEKEKQELEKKEKYYASEEFIEEEARNRLNMAKPGETILVLPPKNNQEIKTSPTETPVPNWKKWWHLFF